MEATEAATEAAKTSSVDILDLLINVAVFTVPTLAEADTELDEVLAISSGARYPMATTETRSAKTLAYIATVDDLMRSLGERFVLDLATIAGDLLTIAPP